LLKLGKLGAADCAIALAAHKSDADTLVVDDWHFSNAAAELKARLKLDVFSPLNP